MRARSASGVSSRPYRKIYREAGVYNSTFFTGEAMRDEVLVLRTRRGIFRLMGFFYERSGGTPHMVFTTLPKGR